MLRYNLVSLISLAQEGHSSAVEESGVTLKIKGGGAVQFSLIGKLCRQYGYHSEATGRMVNTACAVIATGRKRKLPPPLLTSTFSTALTATPTRHCSSRRRSSKKSASTGSFTRAGGTQWQRGSGSPSRGRRTPEKVRTLREYLLISVGRWSYQVSGENGTHL